MSSGATPGPACYGQGGKDPTVTDADLKQFVKENPTFLTVPENVLARTILVATVPSDDAAARKAKKAKAEGLRKQLLAGADFSKLAATMSDDPTRVRGGQLPALRRGQVTDTMFENAAFAQKEGEIGSIIETQYGFVILQVQKHTLANTLKLDDAWFTDPRPRATTAPATNRALP